MNHASEDSKGMAEPIQGGGLLNSRHQQWQEHLANALKRVVETPTSIPPEAPPSPHKREVTAETPSPPADDVVIPAEASAKKQKRKRFTLEETKHLYRGVKRHGEGHWTRILNDKSLSFDPCRTAGSLKDKWRNLKHSKTE